MQDGPEGEYTVHFNSYEEGGKVRMPARLVRPVFKLGSTT